MLTTQEIIQFATQCHQNQIRKGTELPYITHPIAVLNLIATDWLISNRVIWHAAICHDILEDCPNITREKLQEMIGNPALSIVSELTFSPDAQNPRTKQEQKSDYLETFTYKSIESLACKVADRICNTYDFLMTQPDYAPKYWRKANILISLLESRSQELENRFGLISKNRINQSINRLIDLLNSSSFDLKKNSRV